ncbi:unnamed protein product [Thlaspi arvense]|uniref:PGG domain-containing protein n=1 Tax=Thlaspi arvense TaxID=13288 RepID=A0AAU9T146_THLAR|nr:unnamed protein product [Thlaspi arvense]
MPGQNCDCLPLLQLQETSLDDLRCILNRRQDATTAWIDTFGRAPLQEACTCSRLEIIKKLLLDEMTRRGQMQDPYCQSLALDIAAGNGNLKTVKKLFETYPGLVEQMNLAPYGLALPVVRASNAGHGELTRYLYEKTSREILMDNEGYWAKCLLLDAIFFGFLDIALAIFDEVPPVAVVQRPSPLRFLALKPDFFRSHCDLGFWRGRVYSWIGDLDFPPDQSKTWKPSRYQRIMEIYVLKDRHSKADSLLKIMCKALADLEKDESWKETVYDALLVAVENGNKEFFMEIIKCNPELVWISQADSGRNLFQLAVEFRKEKIFNLIYGLDDRKVTLLRSRDKDNNNILHIAAYLSPRPEHLSKISGSALKMQREAQWYEVVKSLVSEREVVQRNNKKMTPRQVFEATHETLRKEGEEWMKYTATACSFVAALIATVTFQAVFTVPGGYDEILGKPLLLRDLHFTAFIIVDTLSFFASCISVLIFLSILTARYSFDDFIVSLPRMMILGLTILFISIASMLVAFITAVSASMRQRPKLVIPLKPLASFPALLFLMFQFPLLKEMISSTYGKGLFRRDTKSWLLSENIQLRDFFI